MTRQEGYGCSFAKLGTLAGVMMKGLKVSHLHGQHGDNIEENLSPRSVLEHRALSGLAIAIDLEEKKNKPLNTGQHVVLGRYCCKQNTNHVSAGQEEHNCLMVGSCHSRDGLTHMTHNVQHTASDAPIVGLQMVASLYPMVHSIGPEASLYPMLHSSSPEWKRLNYSEVGASVPRERMYEEVTRCDERGTHAYLLASKDAKREQEALCPRRINVNMSSNPPLQNVEKLHHSTCKSKENGEAGHGEERFPAGRSMEESIFHYVHPSSSDASHIVTVDNLFPSLGEDFLKICYFCKCHLGVGKDVYIYRGDQAFCSAECRYQQILIDECMGLTA